MQSSLTKGLLDKQVGDKMQKPLSTCDDPTIEFSRMTKRQKKIAKKNDIIFSTLFSRLGDQGVPRLSFKLGFQTANKLPLNINNFKQLMIYVLAGCESPKWVRVINRDKIERVVFVTVFGLGEKVIKDNTRLFSKTASIFERAIPINIPYSFYDKNNILRFYTRCTQSLRGIKLMTNAASTKVRINANVTLGDYLLDKAQMIENKFPCLCEEVSTSDFVFLSKRLIEDDEKKAEGEKEEREASESKKESSSEGKEGAEKGDEDCSTITQDKLPQEALRTGMKRKNEAVLSSYKKLNVNEAHAAHIVGVDCEMVLTQTGRELARCTVVDFFGSVLYDEYCKPDSMIIDYCTKFSGIDEAILARTSKRLQDIQGDLKKILFEDTIICGHSLENDLLALKICHDKIIDTSVLYPHTNGTPWKLSLKLLAKKFLKRNIQLGESGHNSAEDARAAVDLVKMKFENGYSFGHDKTEYESIFSVFRRAGKKSALLAQPCAIKLLTNKENYVSTEPCETAEQTLSKAESFLRREGDFFWIDVAPSGQEEFGPAQMDDAVARIFALCEEKTLFVVASGDLMNDELKICSKSRIEWGKKSDEKFEKEDEFEKKIIEVKQGICLVKIK